jgi:DME family drug/metabolite transporter
LPTQTRKPVRGYFYIATATFFWGVSATLGRAAFTGRLPGLHAVSSIDPLILSQGRATFSFLVLLPMLALLRGRNGLRLPTRDLGQLVLIGILGVAASNYFYYLAIQRTNVATAITVQYTAPIWVLLYTVARGLQKFTLQRVAAVGLAVTGIALVIGVFGSRGLLLDTIGLFAALLAACSFAFYNIGGHDILARRDRWIVLLYTTASASLFWLLVNPPWKLMAAHYSVAQWLFLLLFSLLSVLAPFSFYFAGLQHLEPTRAIIVSCLEPVFSIVIAALVLGEVMRPLQIVGIVFVLAAITVAQLPDRLVEPIE